MAGIHRQIIRCQRLIAKKMQDVKTLAKLDQLLIVGKIASAPAATNIMRIGAPETIPKWI